MIFRYTILYVHDVEATLGFFKSAFGFETAFLHESKDYGELDTGQTKLAFSSIELMQSLGKSPATDPVTNPSFEIAFETGDVAAALAKAVKAGAELVQAAARRTRANRIQKAGACPVLRFNKRCRLRVCTPRSAAACATPARAPAKQAKASLTAGSSST